MSNKKKTNKTKYISSDDVFDVINFILLTLIMLIVVYPLWWIIISSISDPMAVASGQVLLKPVGFNLRGYEEVLNNERVVRGFFNSLVITFVGTSINLIVTLPTAYALSRSKFGGRKIVMAFYMVTMFFGGGLIPTFLVVKNLGLLNTIWALVLPGSMGVYNMIVARTFFQSNISEELYDAAAIDGCSQSRFFFQIALPLSKAIIAVLVLYYGVGHWNSYFSSLVYITDQERYPLQLVLRGILITNETALSQTATTEAARKAMRERQELIAVMKYSLIIISSIPVMLIYPFIQKYFVQGVMIGSVKG